MEIIIALFIGLLGIAFLFMLIEYPYYLLGVFVFIVFYNYNIDLPGPLDSRGLLTLALFFRLIIFDRDNLSIIINILLKNKYFFLIVLFGIYFILVTLYNFGTYKIITRVMIFKFVGLALGFIAAYNGHSKKVFTGAILATGLISVADLVNHYLTSSGFHITRILDKAFKSKYSADWNHNTFGMFIGIALIIVYVFSFTKQIKILTAVVLLTTLGVGIVLSTSRGTMLSVFIAILVGTLLFPRKNINVKKIFLASFGFFFLALLIAISSIFIFKSFGLKADFINKLSYRLLEEPLSIFEGKNDKYNLSGSKHVGTIEWRINQAKRDMDEYSKLPIEQQLLGLGNTGYFKISKKEWIYGGKLVKYISHNGYVLLLIERGIIGFIIFIFLYLTLLVISIKSFRRNIQNFPFYIILIFFIIFTYGGQDQLLDRFSYILFGGIIGQYIYTFSSSDVELLEEFEEDITEEELDITQ